MGRKKWGQLGILLLLVQLGKVTRPGQGWVEKSGGQLGVVLLLVQLGEVTRDG